MDKLSSAHVYLRLHKVTAALSFPSSLIGHIAWWSCELAIRMPDGLKVLEAINGWAYVCSRNKVEEQNVPLQAHVCPC